MNVWRGRLARWFTPLARRCPLSPNTITVVALIINLAAAASLYAGRWRPSLFLASIVLLTIGGLADAFDGIVARVQQKESRFGDFLDHVADRISDTLVAAGWLLGSGVRAELAVLAVFLVLLSGYVGTQLEATWRERNYDSVGRGEFVLAMIIYPIVSFILADNGWTSRRFALLSIPEWLTILLLLVALLSIAQRFALARRLERNG